MSAVERIDRFQRKHSVVGFPLAVIYKYNDDQGPYLAAIISYYGFIAIFPLLLIATSVLGFFLQNRPQLQERLLDTVLGQFPIVGDQLGRPDALTGSTGAIVLGAAVALYGAINVGQALQNAANVAWAVPRNSRLHPVLQRLRSLLMLTVAGVGSVAVAVGISVVESPSDVGLSFGLAHTGLIVRAVGLVIWTILLVLMYRMLSLGRADWRSVLPGAVVASFGLQALQYSGDIYVRHVLVRVNAMNQTFALVLGLIGLLFIASALLVLGVEVNVVLRRKLYPRALLAPFTDNVQLGPGDLRAYTSYVRMQRHKGFQRIEVDYDDPATPQASPEAAPEPTVQLPPTDSGQLPPTA